MQLSLSPAIICSAVSRSHSADPVCKWGESKLAEKKEKNEKKNEKMKAAVKRPKAKKDEPIDIIPTGNGKIVPVKAETSAISADVMAQKQKRSLIMFVSSVVLASIIFIPGDMVWLWLHNAVRGTCSILSVFWPMLIMFLSVATMLDKEIPRLVFRTSFGAGLIVALNACIYIFKYDGAFNIRQTFIDGITYTGSGALGFIFGAPFIKLFGIIPAKILIILIIMVLTVFALGIPVKKLYNSLFNIIKNKISESIDNMKNNSANRGSASDNSDDYFDDEDFESYNSVDEDEDEDGDRKKKNSNRNSNYRNVEYDEDEDRLPISPVLSENLFEDEEDDYFPEDEEDPEDDIIIPEKPTPSKSKSKSKSKTNDTDEFYDPPIIMPDLPVSAPDLPTGGSDSYPDEDSIDINIDDMPDTKKAPGNDDDDLFADIFGEDFLDTVDQGFKPETASAVEQIKESKQSAIPVDDLPKKAVVKKEKKRSKKSYIYPPSELLTESKTANVSYERELKENARKLIDTLESFSVGAKIIGYCRGPSVTRYEIQPAPGVKISKITGLSDDIALNLAAEGGVRMEAPIPGKPAIGVEIPNKTVTSVTMRELLESAEFNKNKKSRKLECVIGKDVAGKIVLMDLAKMPHLLIAGTTGSGKSVCVNSILMSILFRATPDEVKMILIDPKLVEFSKYKGIPHLLVPVVSDVKKAAGALGWAVSEMEDRYKELSLYNVKDIDSYNKMVERNLASMTPEEIENGVVEETADGEFAPPKATKKMPKIVIAIDELADLMMAAPGEVEDYICRLAQKARAAGMHLVIATQRPSVNVITGVIKANIPSRISLKVASYVDSKTILDTGGGEKLIGRGDMLYMPVGVPKPIRVQGGFSSDDDIEAVTDFIKEHAQSNYDDEINEEIDRISESVGVKGGSSSKDTSADDIDDSDPMLEDAIKAVVELGQASTSLLQRKLRVGYARAGRLIDTMERMSIVGPHEGSKSRKVLMTQQEYIERKISGVTE